MNALHNTELVVVLGAVSFFEKSSRYATARCKIAAVTSHDALVVWETYVSRVELSLPMRQQPEVTLAPVHLHEREHDLLIGVLDDGCPFASERFLTDPGETRLLAIWDQDLREKKITDGSGTWVFGEIPHGFHYGHEFRRVPGQPLPGHPTPLSLDRWIARHSTANFIDEDRCYSEAKFRTLKFRASHGAHVMDILAGPTPTSSRVSLDRLNPPTFVLANDNASKADIVFVQFSRACIEDPTGVWLDAYVLDGLRYILNFAVAHGGFVRYRNVVVNLSYGRTTGPHNGSALLEQALTELVTVYDGSPGKPKLDISLAGGNYYLTDNHVVFKNETKESASFEWTWRLPPDNTSLCFAEIWMSNGGLEFVEVSLTSPSGVIFTSTVVYAPAGVGPPIVWGANDTMWRLQVEATVLKPRYGAVAEHGLYTIRVAGVPKGKEVHGYVARTDPNMDVPPGPKPSFFVDEDWEQERAASAGCTYVDGEFDNDGNFVSRYGTLNGIDTAEIGRLHVAGSYNLLYERKSPYSSAGPARDGPLPFREGPDYLMLGDDLPTLRGVPAGGNRSGVVFRLIGTSAAAPQLGRWVADEGPDPTKVINPPLPGDVEGVEQSGAGSLNPR